MSAGTPRTPPRFVPTLTTVVELASESPVQQAASSQVPAQRPAEAPAATAGDAHQAAGELPPLAPLTDSLLQPGAPTLLPASSPAMIAIDPAEIERLRLEEELLHRVLQRVDLQLEDRLLETLSVELQRQLETMLPNLRASLEGTLRSLVIDALARELGRNTEG